MYQIWKEIDPLSQLVGRRCRQYRYAHMLNVPMHNKQSESCESMGYCGYRVNIVIDRLVPDSLLAFRGL